MTLRRAVLAGLALAAGAVRPAGAQTVSPLDALPPPGGPLPDGFDSARTGRGRPARWDVVADPTAPGSRAVAQTEADLTGYRFPLLSWRGLSADVEASVRFKAVSGREDRAGGLAVRLLDADTCIVVRANALEDNVRLYRVVHGVRQQFAGADVGVPAGVWHTLGLRAEGHRFTVAFNGRELFTATDAALPGPGHVALWTKADSMTWFSGLTIRKLA